MMLNDVLKHSKTILCLNSTLPDDRSLYEGKYIIATDGAANKLHKLGIAPNIIIGDFDSVDLTEHENVTQIYLPDQNQSDFQKALTYIQEHELAPFTVFGINDGLLDHIICNISIIARQDCVFYAPPILGHVISSQGIHQFTAGKNSKLSIMGLPGATISSEGLKWELHEAKLSFPDKNSWFNRCSNDDFNIKLISGRVIVMIYLESVEDKGLYAV